MIVPEAWSKNEYSTAASYTLFAFSKQVQFNVRQQETGVWLLTSGMAKGKPKEIAVLADGPDILARASDAVVSYMLLEIAQVRAIADGHWFPGARGTVWDRLGESLAQPEPQV